MRIWDINPVDNTVIDPVGREAPRDTMRGDPLVPAGATTIEPPEVSDQQAARWDGATWKVVSDWRGHVYWTDDRERHEITELGVEPPADALDEEPPETLTDLAAHKRAEIDTARDAAFAAGLEYDIAGEPDVVQTRPQDQINLLGLSAKAQLLITDGVTDTVMPFRGLSNITRLLTPEQMSELALAALAHIEGIYRHSWERKDSIDAITTDEELDEEEKREAFRAIQW